MSQGQAKSLAPCEYKTGKKLGEGSYAVVKEAVHVKTGERFAVKIISKELMRGREDMILNEINVLKQISQGHPHIITLHDFFETPNNLYLVMDLCKGGELFDRICEIGYYYEADAAHIVKIVLSAVAYLHDKNVVHRDIKPENLIFKTKNSLDDLLIADFGLSKITDNGPFQAMMTRCGTPGYMAPEVVKGLPYGKPVDLWSIGVLTYFLLCGYTPFDAKTAAQEVQNVIKCQYAFEPTEYWSHVSDLARDFIRKLLQLDPEKRLTARQALEHPWIKSHQTEKEKTHDLLPKVKDGFNARKTFRKAIDVVKAVNKFHAISANPSNDLGALKPVEDIEENGALMVINRKQ